MLRKRIFQTPAIFGFSESKVVSKKIKDHVCVIVAKFSNDVKNKQIKTFAQILLCMLVSFISDGLSFILCLKARSIWILFELEASGFYGCECDSFLKPHPKVVKRVEMTEVVISTNITVVSIIPLIILSG